MQWGGAIITVLGGAINTGGRDRCNNYSLGWCKNMLILLFFAGLNICPFCVLTTGVQMMYKAYYGSKEEGSQWAIFYK